MIETYIIGILVLFLMGQQVYWSLLCSNLVNKIMSRDYQGYVQARAEPKLRQPISDDLGDPIAEEHAESANALLGLV